MEKVNRETAEAEVTAWLDHKKLSPKRRESKKEVIESLIELVQDGTIVIDQENFEIKQILKFEIGNQEKIRELIWKPFGNVGKVQIFMKNVESADYSGNCIAYACAQTGQSKNIINALEYEDATVIKVIANFFM